MDDPYWYPGTRVLRSKENIRDEHALEASGRVGRGALFAPCPHGTKEGPASVENVDYQ
jgi:hypothetical protein